jgi:cation diffusion facilitator family transporter
MVVEIAAGLMTGSMALLADGWHMASHAGALGMTGLAYWIARRYATSKNFTFGTGKVYALAGYSSALALGLGALVMIAESIERLVVPTTIEYWQALPVAVIGLVVNLLCAKVLHESDGHGHGHGHEHAQKHHHDHDADGHHHDHRADHNLQAAYLHVLADALTSVCAIIALLFGAWFGWAFLDPTMGIVGGLIIFKWSIALTKSSGRELLDMAPDAHIEAHIREAVEAVDGASVADLHLWKVGPAGLSCIVHVQSDTDVPSRVYREKITDSVDLAHLTIEVHRPGLKQTA